MNHPAFRPIRPVDVVWIGAGMFVAYLLLVLTGGQ